jgi:hypothetical protein
MPTIIRDATLVLGRTELGHYLWGRDQTGQGRYLCADGRWRHKNNGSREHHIYFDDIDKMKETLHRYHPNMILPEPRPSKRSS